MTRNTTNGKTNKTKIYGLLQTCTANETKYKIPDVERSQKIQQRLIMKEIPTLSIALVLTDSRREPTEKEYEKLKEKTTEFWTGRLKQVYTSQFERLTVRFDKKVHGTNAKEEYNLYLEASAEVLFSSDKDKGQSGDEILREILAADSKAYLSKYVRDVGAASPFATASRVRVQRLEPLTLGGATKSPPFYIAFGTDGTNDANPTPNEINEYKVRTREHIQAHLQSEYPNSFVGCELQVTDIQIYAKKPDERYKLYVEHSLTATFSADPPSPSELFGVVMRLARTTNYMQTMHEIEGSPFGSVTMMTIRLIGVVLPPVPELPPPPEDDGEGAGAGDPDDEEIITLDGSIFLALVIMSEPPGSLPTKMELSDLQSLVYRYFYSLIKSRYLCMTGMDLVEKSTEYGSGVPEKRFNMCVEYSGKFHFKAKGAPSERTLKLLVLHCDLGAILALVRSMKPQCFSRATEITMQRKGHKKEPVQVVEDPTFEAAIDPPIESPPSLPPLLPSPPQEPKPKKPKVESSDVFVALKVDGIKSDPSDKDYERLRQETSNFFEKRVKEAFPNQFESLDLGIALKEFGTGKPNPKYNVYIEWTIRSSFASPGSSSSKTKIQVEGKKGSMTERREPKAGGVPGPVELTTAIVKGVDFMDYLINYVRILEGTVFANVTAGYIKQRVNDNVD